ncbi:MAG: 3-deoxy-D-manno-octulosonic acid transferase [Cytophagaceae bacterium]
MSADLKGKTAERIWFHTASLGEFEQARPIMEALKEKHPDLSIILTFFSPSGYEIRKNYAYADHVYYLPADTPANAEKFIEIIDPYIAFFTKYDFWLNYLSALQAKQIPVIAISCLFRKDQIYFKSIAHTYKTVLKKIDCIFVQNKESAEVLKSNGFSNYVIAGDTRYDRVTQNATQVKSIPSIQQFKQDKPLIVIGSSWPEDLNVLIPFINNFTNDLKVIIAPHEINQAEIAKTALQLKRKSIKFSQLPDTEPNDYDVLFIDNIGMLSSLYHYADYAYIGGAFGKGLHNILEAAVFGTPIFFGPNYEKFPEAIQLIEHGCAFPVKNTQVFINQFVDLYQNPEKRKTITQESKRLIKNNTGGSEKILNYCKTFF